MRKKTVMDMEWLRARVSEESNGCWRWTKSLMVSGYGQATVNREHVTAHRAAYFIANGEWPEIARHKCDNRWCANPDHIESGSYADNARDFAERSNAHRGQDHEWSKLTDAQVLEIRELLSVGVKQVEIASMYNMAQSTISNIKTGKIRRTR
jgi:hypothetical protein